MSRKNGKTALVSIVLLYCLIADNEPNAQVICSAPTMKQADIVFKMSNTYLRQITKKGKTYRTSQIKLDDNELFIISGDATTNDGWNCSAFVCDESAAFNNDVWGVLRSSQGSRLQPIAISISTASGDKKSLAYQQREYGIKILQNEIINDIYCPLIWELDQGDDPYDENNWIKSNPSLNVTVSSVYIENQLITAKQDVTQTAAILTKTLNIWQNSKFQWIHDQIIKDCLISENEWFDKLKSKLNQLYLGVDLSSVSDLSALAMMYYLDKQYYFNVKYYLPENFTNYQQNMMYYRSLAANNHISLTIGNVVDYNYIINDILSMRDNARIINLFYDSYNSPMFIQLCKAAKIPTEPFSQTIGSYNRPTKHLQREILSGNVKFVDNPLIINNFNDVIIKKDLNSNEKPFKEDHLNHHIDGVIASIIALAAWMLDDKKRL